MVYSEAAMLHLRHSGRIVYLHAPLATLKERIGVGSARGLAKPPEQSLEELYAEREPFYCPRFRANGPVYQSPAREGRVSRSPDRQGPRARLNGAQSVRAGSLCKGKVG